MSDSTATDADDDVEAVVNLTAQKAAESASRTEKSTDTVLRTENLSVFYDDDQALNDVTMEIQRQRVTAIIGPSGCGKSTFLRCINRMNDQIPAARVTGKLYLDGKNIYTDDIDPVALRRKIGMVFQEPNPFPKSIYDNVAFGLRIQNRHSTDNLDEKVEKALRQAALWDEVKDQLHSSGLNLSGGQQQRLCLARALVVEPDIILMDEPASALDPIATGKIEDLIDELRQDYTIVIVTHNMQQAARISDKTAVFLTGGELVEFDDTDTIFENPDNQRVEDYITGKFG